jgi:hypothetical protein
MSVFSVGNVTVKEEGRVSTFTGKPTRNKDETVGDVLLADLETPDGFKGTVGVISWPEGEIDVRLVDFSQGAEAYERQKIAGTMTIKAIGESWIIRVRALKINGRDWPTLNRVSWHDLDWLAGEDAQSLLKKHGATEFGLYGDLAPGAGAAHRADVGMKVPVAAIEPIAALYALTRTQAIMKNFGASVDAGVVE